MDLQNIRSQFPALQRQENNRTVIWCDAPGGTQLPYAVIDAMAHFLRSGTTNLHGAFGASHDMDELVLKARQRAATFIGVDDPEEIHFGQNASSLQFALSHALAHNWKPGSSIIVSQLDHYANVSPWIRAAADHGVEVRTWKVNDQAELAFSDLEALMDDSVELIAITAASNAIGSIVDIATVTALAHKHGALVAVDAVHLGPHKLIDAPALACDILTCSAYKFFGPHIGFQWMPQSLRDTLNVYKVKPAPDSGAARFETGTVNLEALAGLVACIDYLKDIQPAQAKDDREKLIQSMGAVFNHECELSRHFINGISALPDYTLHGYGLDKLKHRTPTFGLSHKQINADVLAKRLAELGIYSWSGHFYACDVTSALGLNDRGGLLRIGFAHYHSIAEVDRVLDALNSIIQ